MVKGQTTIAIPPGATIAELIEDRGMTPEELAARTGLPEEHVRELVDGRVPLTEDVARRLEAVFGVPARFWLNLEANWRADLRKVWAEAELDPRRVEGTDEEEEHLWDSVSVPMTEEDWRLVLE
ncbi:MAG: helix-turn-helix domain-containing protein [Synergistaceae bacterium]|nr:helix-turn-helix domain-containing protein [Synergistaceae bacterium]